MSNHYSFEIGRASIPVGPKDQIKVDWKLGVPVFESVDDLKAGKAITGELKIGETVFVPGLVGDIQKMVVKTNDPDWATLENVGLFAALEFDKDDRHCWICTGLNSRADAVRNPTQSELDELSW